MKIGFSTAAALLLPLLPLRAAASIPSDQIRSAFQAKSEGVHPRLFADAKKFEEVKRRIQTDPQFQAWFAEYRDYGDAMFNDPPPVYVAEKMHGLRNMLNQVSRPLVAHLQAWAFLYRITGDVKYANRARQDLKAVAAFPDLGLKQSVLNVGEMAYAHALAYDWLYDALTPAERASICHLLQRHAFEPTVALLQGGTGFARGRSNVTDVVVGGVVMAALATMDVAPESAQVVSAMLVPFQKRLDEEYYPDGAGSEGPMYWSYAIRYSVPLLAALHSTLGTDFGLSDRVGLRGSGAYALYTTGPSGASFGYSDSWSRGLHPPQLLWLAARYQDPTLGWLALQTPTSEATITVQPARKRGRQRDAAQPPNPDAGENASPENSGPPLDPFRFLWAEPEKYGPPTEKTSPLARRFRGRVELAYYRTAWNDSRALHVGLKGGTNWLGHGDLDIGDFVLDADGVQWTAELGLESYSAPGYGDRTGPRWNYYRKRAEGQNTLVIAPGPGPDQQEGVSPITAFSDIPGHFFAVVDMTSAYVASAKSVRRGLRVTGKTAWLQDEIETKAPAEVFWFMHTRAGITLEDGGKRARLAQNGRTLFVRCVAPQEALFTVMEAVPLPSSPQPKENNPNRGVQKLTIRLPQVSRTAIAVSFTTEGNQPASPLVALAAWK